MLIRRPADIKPSEITDPRFITSAANSLKARLR